MRYGSLTRLTFVVWYRTFQISYSSILVAVRTKSRPRTLTETTLDVAGLPKEKIQYLKDLIALWSEQAEDSEGIQFITKRKVDPSEFIVKNSNVIGGEVTRAMAYDEQRF